MIHHFARQDGDPLELGLPGTIAQSRGGAMFTTARGSLHGNASVAFRIWPGGDVQILHRFTTPGDFSPNGLTLATDGKFYGGASAGAGSIFKMSQDGLVTTLYRFTGGSDGASPYGPPIQSVEGDFYGVTSGNQVSGPAEHGSVYRITKYGKFTLLHTFVGSDGSEPDSPLVQGTDHYFYGTTHFGGTNGYGTIFRVSSSGAFKVLVNFNRNNGACHCSGLIQANDGNFYGVTAFGGDSGWGVLFRMTPDGKLEILHDFTGTGDGGNPIGGLVQASDGNLYGTDTLGGENNYGVLFNSTLSGAMTPLHSFTDATGSYPWSSLIQHTNGMLYGDTFGGGKFQQGVFYSLDAGLPPFVSYLPTYGRAGALVQILGQGFTSGSQVYFNGTPAASPVVVYPTYLRVMVPSGATTGPITVTTAGGILSSNKVFIVHPN
jgi:uncharacterized repeat protein (TIGR03803 family)